MSERVRFTVDGRPVAADVGTSLLAALWNHGAAARRVSVRGSARGPLCAMGSCFECRVTIDGQAQRRSCMERVRDGMVVQTGTALPTPGSAQLAGGDGAGGEQLQADVAVVGGGPAGVAAAVHAAEAGARTLLLDEAARPGGQIWRHRDAPPPAARAWLERLARSGARVLTQAGIVDASPSALSVERDGQPLLVSTRRLVLATGARELFLPFPGWTLPGVLGAGAAQALLKAGGDFGGRRVVVAGSGPLLVAVAAALRGAGARVVGIVEQAPLARLLSFGARLGGARLAEGLGYAARLVGVPYRSAAWVEQAFGRDALERVSVSDGRSAWSWDCDVLACGFGLVPNLELGRRLGCETAAAGLRADERQQTSVPGVFAAGELVGIAGVGHALVTGAIAGLAAAGRPLPHALVARRARETAFAARLGRAFALRPELSALARADTLVCRCEDVALGAVDAEAPAGARAVKLRTRAGMGACQGRVCGAALAQLRGFAPDSSRPPVVPAMLCTLACDPATEEER